MEVITIEWLFMVIGLLAGALAASGLTALFYHKGYSKKGQELLEDRQKTDEEAVAIITDAIKKGEDRKREILLSVKEEVHKSKLELERDVRERRQELTRERERIDTKETTLDRRAQSLEDREQNFKQREDRLQDQEVEIAAIESQKRVELERVAGLSVTEARDIVLQTAETEFRYDLSVLYKKIEDEARTTAQERAREIVVTTIQRYASDYVSESTVSVVTLPNEEMKGRIIGREGRNIRTIEQLTGVDLIIDDTPEAVILSSFDPVRREIARISIEKLVQDGRIHPTRIEEMVRKATKEVEASMREAGEQVVFDTNVAGIPEEIVHMLGRLKYRTSYGQNVLQHAVEVSRIAGMLAAELDLDVAAAKKAGLLHDLGKAVDFEMDGSHVELGAELARRYKLDPITINSIESHHGDVEPETPIACLVSAADAISAARPGARRENIETYIKRIEKLEEIAESIPGVEKSYAVQAGREVRVIVEPDAVTDEEMPLLVHEICKKIEQELNFPGQIKVNMIRESRYSDFAK
ncbi:MAG: ribonuclease Y [Clostridiales bacterium]|jgi:ribonuclease Y|nr:ribonuclease Y [Clostridiales bacterium]MDD3540652.1 ribonuclease Y [Eubacteriales bacterium]NLG30289.1 ribonuclease Y [Clostridiaceae bacterium]